LFLIKFITQLISVVTIALYGLLKLVDIGHIPWVDVRHDVLIKVIKKMHVSIMFLWLPALIWIGFGLSDEGFHLLEVL
jgi:hypothetical protein